MNYKHSFLLALVALFAIVSPVLASEITGTLTAGSGSTIEGTVIGPPIASPAPGTYGTAQSITLISPGASSIRYTIDGSDPTCAGGGLLYISPIVVSSSFTIRAVSCYLSGTSSNVGSYTYVISGGSLSGTVATSSGGVLSGTVTSSPGGGTLSGTVVSSGGGSGGGGGGSSGGGSGGGGGTTITATTPSTGGGGGSVVVPSMPSTGAGGEATQAIATLLVSALTVLFGSWYLMMRQSDNWV